MAPTALPIHIFGEKVRLRSITDALKFSNKSFFPQAFISRPEVQPSKDDLATKEGIETTEHLIVSGNILTSTTKSSLDSEHCQVNSLSTPDIPSRLSLYQQPSTGDKPRINNDQAESNDSSSRLDSKQGPALNNQRFTFDHILSPDQKSRLEFFQGFSISKPLVGGLDQASKDLRFAFQQNISTDNSKLSLNQSLSLYVAKLNVVKNNLQRTKSN